MAKKLSSVLGIDIGSQSIKVAELRMQGHQPTITALGAADTPEGAVDHIGVHDVDSVGAMLKQLCTTCGASVNDVVISVAGQGSVLVRTLEVPVMNEAELKQHMDWEITRNIPFAESTVVSDYQAFEPDPNNAQNMDVVMAISPQSTVDSIVSMLKKAGKKPAAIDVEPLGIARTLRFGYEGLLLDKSVCVVEFGHKTTAINIYRNGKLLMPRQVPIGGEMFTKAIADGLSLSFEEAQQVKHDKLAIPESAASQVYNPFAAPAETQEFAPYNPFAEPEDLTTPEELPAPESEAPIDEPKPPVLPEDSEATHIYNAVAGVLDEFVAEVRRSIDYFRSKGGDVDQILLCGGGAKLKGLAPFLASVVSLPTDLLDPVKGITLNPRKADGSVTEDGHQEFAVAVGNCLHICF